MHLTDLSPTSPFSPPKTSAPVLNRSNTIGFYGKYYVAVRFILDSTFGIRSWRSHEAMIQYLAVGIYFSAALVLTSTLFLNLDKAITCATGRHFASTAFELCQFCHNVQEASRFISLLKDFPLFHCFMVVLRRDCLEGSERLGLVSFFYL